MAGARNVKWYRLDDFQCPAQNCSSKEKYNWVCNADGSNIFIAQIGELQCSCSNGPIHRGQICTWRFDCGNHGEAGFMKADPEKFTFAVSQALQLMGKAGFGLGGGARDEYRVSIRNLSKLPYVKNDDKMQLYFTMPIML